MLQTGMRAPIGIKISGSNLKQIEGFGLQLEKIIKEVPGVNEASVFAERMVGKPYLEIRIDRKAIARYGLQIEDVQKHLSVALGGMALSSSVEGRERYSIRIRYPRELRSDENGIQKFSFQPPWGVLFLWKSWLSWNMFKGHR